MNGFKTTLINCQQCGRRILIRAADAERGCIVCSHVGCGAVNRLQETFQYDEAIVRGLPDFGTLTYLDNPERVFPLQFGPNVIGTAETCTVRLERFSHDGRCYISRRHCTLTIVFDQWRGRLRYQLQDGVLDTRKRELQPSLNGTLLHEMPLQKMEVIDVENDGVITLGGVDRFRLTHYFIPPAMLATYKIALVYHPDRTE